MAPALEPAISQPLSCVAVASFTVNVYTEVSSITDACIQKNMLNKSHYNSELKIADCIPCAGGPERVCKPNDGQGRVIALRPRINAASNPECIVMFNARRKDLGCQELIGNVLMW